MAGFRDDAIRYFEAAWKITERPAHDPVWMDYVRKGAEKPGGMEQGFFRNVWLPVPQWVPTTHIAPLPTSPVYDERLHGFRA